MSVTNGSDNVLKAVGRFQGIPQEATDDEVGVCMNGLVAHSPSQPSLTTSATPIVKNPIVGQTSENPGFREWTPGMWEDFRA